MSVVDELDEQTRSQTPSDDSNFSSLLEVRCGQLTARLHMDKFICPGIHQQCIELDGELITPKQFTIRANKDKQKDWKGSIRIGKSNMRSLMECKTLDFHNHDSYCSAKCQSRNYISSKSYVSDLSSLKPDLFFGASTSNCCGTNQSATGSANALQQLISNPSTLASILPGILNEQLFLSSILSPGNNRQLIDNSSFKLEDINNQSNMLNVHKAMESNPSKFWSMVVEMGLFDEIMAMINTALSQTQRFVGMGSVQRDAVAEKLSRMARVLELEEVISSRIHAKRVQWLLDGNALKNKFQAELQRKSEECQKELAETRQKVALIDEVLFDQGTTPSTKRHRTCSSDFKMSTSSE